MEAFQLFYVTEYFYAVSATFIKFSVAVALLRIATGRKPFQWALWILMGLTFIAALVFCVGIANICAFSRRYFTTNIPLTTT